MGLDNGIKVKSRHRILTREMLPDEIEYPFKEDYSEGIEILYWRKNWGLRNAFIHYFGGENDDGCYEIETSSQIFELIKIIINFMDRETWEDEGDSIWEYDEILYTLQRDIINLAIMAAFMENNPDVYLEFYDSY